MFSSSSSDEEKLNRVSPRRVLQGPRPPVLKVGKNSYKIKKNPHPHPAATHPTTTTRLPVVIHLKSPEILHIKPQDFMGIVQELTGKPKPLSTSKSSSSLSTSASLSTSSGSRSVEDYRTCENLELKGDVVMMNGSHVHGMSPSFQKGDVVMMNGSHVHGMSPSLQMGDVMMMNGYHVHGMSPSLQMVHQSNLSSPSMYPGLFLPSPNVYTNWLDFGPIF